MSKASGTTRTINSSNASASRKASAVQSKIGGAVKTSDEALKVMNSYKNLYNMPQKEQKAFTDTFNQAILDTYNKKKDNYEKDYLKKTNEAFAKNDKILYDNATKLYNTKMKLLNEERTLLTDKYNNFIEVKK